MDQAIQAKESVAIKDENETLATIHPGERLPPLRQAAGMTGTANHRGQRFHHDYKLGAGSDPTDKLMIRADQVDVIDETVEKAKFERRRGYRRKA